VGTEVQTPYIDSRVKVRFYRVVSVGSNSRLRCTTIQLLKLAQAILITWSASNGVARTVCKVSMVVTGPAEKSCFAVRLPLTESTQYNIALKEVCNGY
jgi:hypothetical protein